MSNGVDFDPTQYEPVEEKGGVDFDPKQYEPVEEIPEAPGETPDSALEQSMAVASTRNPDQEADYIKLGQHYNVSPEFAKNNYEMLTQKKQADALPISKVIAATPSLAKFLSTPENASVAKDDVQPLASIEKATQDHGFGMGLVDSVRSGLFSLGSSVVKAPALAYGGTEYDAYGNPVTDYYNADDAANLNKIQQQAPPSYLYKNKITGFLDERAKAYAPPEMSKDIIAEAREGNYVNASKAMAYQIASNLPQLGMIAISRGAGLPFMFATSASQKMAQNLEAGVPVDKARSNALVTGGIETGTEAMFGIGSSAFKESIKAATKSLGKEGAKELFTQAVKEIAKSAGEEGAEEFVGSVAQDLVDYGSGVDDKALDGMFQKAANSFLVGAGSGGIVTGGAVSVEHSFQMFQKSAEATSTKDTYNAIGSAAKESKLNGRLPEKLKEFIGQTVEGTPLQDVFMPIEAFESYFQSKKISPIQAAQELGIAEKYSVAKESGADISMPMKEWVANSVNTEHYEGLQNDIKFSPDELTLNQAKLENESLKKDLTAQAEAASSVVETPAVPKIDHSKSVNEIGKQVKEQLVAAGRSNAQATAEATLYKNVFKTLGENENINPKEFFDSLNLTIGAGVEAQAGAGVLNQSQIPDGQRRGVKYQADVKGNTLSLNPIKGVEAQGSILKIGPSGGSTLVIGKLQTNKTSLAMTADLIDSLERGASMKGASLAMTSAKRLGMMPDSHIGKLLVESGYTAKVGADGDTVFTKKLELPDVYNQAQGEGGGEAPRGQIKFGQDSIRIELLKSADASTFIHESGHLFFEVMKRLSEREGASEQIKNDYKTLIEFAGGKLGEKISVESHEKVAEEFEKYLMSGKAPIRALQKIFTQIKTWMLATYKSLVNQNIEISPDIRQVFDRLLVSQTAIQNAEAEQGMDKSFFSNLQAAGLNDEQISKYQEAVQAASEAAEDQIRRKLMEDVTKRDQAFYKEKRQGVEAQVKTELSDKLSYNALSVLQKGTTVNGSPVADGLEGLKINTETLKDRLSPEEIKALPKGISSPDGLHLEIAAEMLGFRDGNAMLDSFKDLPKLKEAIQAETEKRMQEFYPDYLNSPEISDDSVKAIHNEKRGAVLRMELKSLLDNSLPVVKDAIRRVAKRLPTDEAVKNQALDIIGAQSGEEIKPSLYRRAEQRLRKEAGELVAKGDFEGAFEAKRKELLNFELYLAAEAARTDIKDSLSTFRRNFKPDEKIAKTRDTDVVSAARAILSGVGITQGEKVPEDFLGKMKKYDIDRYNDLMENHIAPMLALGDTAEGDYSKLPYDAFVEMKDTVNALWDLAKSENEFVTKDAKLQLAEVQGAMEARLNDLSKGGGPTQFEGTQTTGEGIKTTLLSFKAALTRVEHWANTVSSPAQEFTNYLWRPISDARNDYKLAKERVAKQYLEISKILDKKSLNKGPIIAPEISQTKGGFETKKDLIGALLHTGNESNLRKLLIGRGWGTLNEDGSLNTTKWDQFIERMNKEGILTKSDYDWAQAVWDLNDTLKVDAQKAHKKLYGFYFNEITAKTFTNQHGEYRGGYVPAVADPTRSEDGAIREEKNAMERGQNSFMFPSTGRGFTKGRVEQYATPLSINIELVGSHIDKVLRFTHLEPAVKQSAKIVMNDGFRANLAEYDPQAGAEMLVPWLQRAASQRINQPSGNGKAWRAMDSFFTTLKNRTGMNIMAGNTINVLQNYTGLFVAASKVKTSKLLGATYDYATNSREMVKIAGEKSPFMRSELTSQMADIQSETRSIFADDGAIGTVREFLQKNAYVLQKMSQNQNNTIVWHGAYNEAIEIGQLENEAVQRADAAVRLTQGSLEATDVSRFETGSPMMRIFTQFYSYFNNLANLQASEVQKISRDIGLRKGAGKLFGLFMVTLYLPAVTSEILRLLASGEAPDLDDDDSMANAAFGVFFASPLKFFGAGIPFAGSVATTVSNSFNDKHYDDKLNVSPVISTLESMVLLPKELYDAIGDNVKDSTNKRAIRDSLTFIGLMTGTPAAVIAKPINYLIDDSESTGPIDATRGFITGKARK